MENKKDYEIKMDGNEHKFGEATRYTKEGKGRFDLIPGDIIGDIIRDCISIGDDPIGETMETTITSAVISAVDANYSSAIINMCIVEYADEICELCLLEYEEIDREYIVNSMFPRMIRDLAIHFQKGAEKYGERNCEKGIPLWSFRDSGLRHMFQWLIGETDENHFIAAIWNFVMALWTIKHHPERCGDKPESTETVNDSSNNKKEPTKTKYAANTINTFKEIDAIFGAIFGE